MIDINTIILHKFAIYLVAILFFFSVLIMHRFFSRNISGSNAGWTLKIALFGMALTFLETSITEYPGYVQFVQVAEALVVMVCIASLLNYVIIDGYIHFKTKKRPPNIIRELVSIGIYGLFLIISLRVIFKVEISTLVASSAVFTAAVAFAMQSTIANIASGFAIQLDKNLSRKTWVYLKDKDITGEIMNVGVRYTTLRDRENVLIMVPNTVMVQSVVKNVGNTENVEKTAIIINVGLGYELPPELAKRIIKETLHYNIHVLKEPPAQAYVESFADSSIVYRLKFYIDDFANLDAIRSSVLSSLWYSFLREGYDFPYPHLELINKVPVHPFKLDRVTIISRLRNVEIFASLSDADLDVITTKAVVKVYAPNEAVIRQGEAGDTLLIVNSGKLDVDINTVKVGSLREGDFLGEMSLLTGERRGATVIAVSEAWLIEISKETIEPVLRNNPKLLETLSSILAARAEKNKKYLDSVTTGSGMSMQDDFLRKLKQFFGF